MCVWGGELIFFLGGCYGGSKGGGWSRGLVARLGVGCDVVMWGIRGM